MLTKGAIGNLINRYRAVLKNCHLLNTFGSLAMAAMLTMGTCSAAFAADIGSIVNTDVTLSQDTTITADKTTETSTRYAGIIADSDNTTVTMKDGATLTVNVDNTNDRAYAVAATNGYTLTFNGTGQFFANEDATNIDARVLRNSNANLVMNGNIYAHAQSPSTTIGLDVWGSASDASATFLGKSTIIEVEDLNNSSSNAVIGAQIVSENNHKAEVSFATDYTKLSNISKNFGQGWANAVLIKGDGTTLTFSGNQTEVISSNTGYTAQAFSVVNGATVTFAGNDVNITSQSDYGANGIGDANADGNTTPTSVIFSGKKATINTVITDGVGTTNNVGLNIGNTLKVRNSVEELNINVYGSGQWNGNGGFANGTAGIYSVGDIDIEGKTLNINVISGQAVDGVNTFDKNQAETTKDYSSAYGMHLLNGTFSTGKDTDVNVHIDEGYKDAVGIYSLVDAHLDGNILMDVSGSTGATAVSADDTAKISLGSEGKQVVLAASSDNNNAVALQVSQQGSVNLAGYTTLSADKALAGNGLVTNQGELTVAKGTVSDFTGSYKQTSGSTALGSDSGFFGGDVLLEKGTLAVAMTEQTGVTAGADEAMLSLGKSVTVAQGKRLVVGNVAADSTAQVAFGNNSLLVVDGKAANAGAMITGTGAISVDKGSKLYIANARAGEAYTITDGLSTNKDEYWDSANLLAGRLVEAEVNLDGDSIVVATKAQDAAKVLPGIIPVVALNTMVSNNLNDTESSSAGIRFLSRAMDNVQFMPNDATATAMVNEVSRAAVTAGVQNTALRLADAGVDQLIHHLSLSFFGKENNIHKDGVDIWATPMYGNTYTHGMAASGAAVRGNYGGVTLGADAKVGEILGGKVRVGAAVNGGGGKSETRGTATSTDNEYNFGGVNLYAGWNLDSLNVMASVGYAMANHDVKMNLPASMGMGQAKADVDTNAFIADLRAEYQINTGVADILPHAGVRYTALNTESHNLKVDGSTLNSVASDTQHIVQFPIGVTVSKDIDVSGWNVKPLADVSVIPAAGEKKNTTKVSYAGIGALDSVNTRIMDSTSWAGTLGVQAEKGNFALGLNYGVQASTHETDQSVSVGISWKF